MADRPLRGSDQSLLVSRLLPQAIAKRIGPCALITCDATKLLIIFSNQETADST